MKNLIMFVEKNGLKIMLGGLAILIGSLFLTISKPSDPVLKKISIILGICGFIIYLTGRIGVFGAKKRSQAERMTTDLSDIEKNAASENHDTPKEK